MAVTSCPEGVVFGPTGRWFVGIDWGSQEHVVSLCDELALKGAVSPLGVDHGRFTGAQVRCRCSPTRSGHGLSLVAPGESARSRKIAPFGPSPAWARVVSLRSTPRAHATLPSQGPREERTGLSRKRLSALTRLGHGA